MIHDFILFDYLAHQDIINGIQYDFVILELCHMITYSIVSHDFFFQLSLSFGLSRTLQEYQSHFVFQEHYRYSCVYFLNYGTISFHTKDIIEYVLMNPCPC